MENSVIKVDHVSKVYKLYDKPIDRLYETLGFKKSNTHTEFYALHDVDFEVHKGETVGIIGTNGSGKSTILKIITGVLNPTEGNVSVKGRISALLELGAGFNMEYTGIENVYLNGTMLGYTHEEIDEKLQDIIDFADIGDFVYQPVKSYSSGMFVRLAFAVAINIDPEILIVDEALSVGDVFFQAKCYKKFEEFKKKGKTILFVTHDLSSVITYCDRAILLNQGVKLSEGTPKEMVDLYKKVLSNTLDENDTEQTQKKSTSVSCNPTHLDYGNGNATITNFDVFDENGKSTDTLDKGTEFTIKMSVKFHSNVEDPIFAFTIKNSKGVEITGTNTRMEKICIQSAKAGEEYSITFRQKLTLQGGEYLISLGCTSFGEEGLIIHHRLFDICKLSVITDKHTVGFVDPFSDVEVKKES